MPEPVYGTKVTAYFAARLAALAATPNQPPVIDFTAGLLKVGDGNGAPVLIDTLIANGELVNEVWAGATISGVSLNAEQPNQIDILCVIPAGVEGVEIGPFDVREFAIYDELNELCVVGTSLMHKTTAGQNNQPSDLIFIASISVAAATPIIQTNPTAYFATLIDVRNKINANRMLAIAPFQIDEAVQGDGWIRQTGKVRGASKPADNAANDAPNTGYGRPASNKEALVDKAPMAGWFQWPWVTIEQLWSAIGTIVLPTIPGTLAPLFFDGGANKYGCATSTAAQVREGDSTTTVVTPSALANSAAPQTLADSASIAWDMGQGYNAEVTLGGNRALAAPTNPKLGITYSLVVKQDDAGARLLTFDAVFRWGVAGPPVLSTGAQKRDLVTMICTRVAPSAEFACALAVRGF